MNRSLQVVISASTCAPHLPLCCPWPQLVLCARPLFKQWCVPTPLEAARMQSRPTRSLCNGLLQVSVALLNEDGLNTCTGTVVSNMTVPFEACLSFSGSSYTLVCNSMTQGIEVTAYATPHCPSKLLSTSMYQGGCNYANAGLMSYGVCTNATGELVEVTTYSSGFCNGTAGSGNESSTVTMLSGGMCNAYGGSGYQVNLAGLTLKYTAFYGNSLCQGNSLTYTAMLSPASRTERGVRSIGSQGCATSFEVSNGSVIDGAIDFFVYDYSAAQSSVASTVVMVGALTASVAVLCA